VRATPWAAISSAWRRSILEQTGRVVWRSRIVPGRGEAGRLATVFLYVTIGWDFRASAEWIFRLRISADRSRDDRELARAASSLRFADGVGPTCDRHRRSPLGPKKANSRAALEAKRHYGCASGKYPLANKEFIYWTDLKRSEFLLSRRDPGPELEDLIVAKLASPADRPRILIHDVVSRQSLEPRPGPDSAFTLLPRHRRHQFRGRRLQRYFVTPRSQNADRLFRLMENGLTKTRLWRASSRFFRSVIPCHRRPLE